MIDCLTSDIMEDYEAWLRNKGITPNTVSFYIRILRAVYNRAAEHDLIDNRHPFRHVYTGIGKTVKRALPLAQIKEIKSVISEEWAMIRKPPLRYTGQVSTRMTWTEPIAS